MNEEQSAEWRAIRAEQEALRAQAERLERRLRQFEKAESSAPAVPPPAAPELPAAVPVPTASAPPLPTPPPIPEPVSRLPTFLAPVPPPVAPVVHAPIRSKSLEMRIGSVWGVYVGVALLLAALASLGDHLYRNIVQFAGPVVKVTLLYLGAAALAGVGAWIERTRKGKEHIDLRNYARVLLGGGLAAAYYVTYAAHHFSNLRIIGSAFVDSLLLIGWTVVMVWMADRCGSQTMAALAVLLAFATSSLSEVSGFTLVAGVPLAAGAVVLMRRHLWKVFPFVCLLATFGSFAFWRLLHQFGEWSGPLHSQAAISLASGGFWTEGAFLLLYWLLFTWVVFGTDEGVMPVVSRAAFAALNNGMFFLTVTWLCLERDPATFWKWPLVFGVALLALAEVCRWLPEGRKRFTENIYLLEGVLCVTLGFIAYFSGWHFSLLMAVESVVLLAASERRHNRWLVGASVLPAVLAFASAMHQIGLIGGGDFKLLGPAVAALLAVSVWLCERSPIASVAGAASVVFELLTVILCIAWGEQYFAYRANFSLFALAGAVVFIVGIEARRERLLFWSYFLTATGLVTFLVFYHADDRRQLIQLLGIVCLFGQRQFTRVRMLSFWSAAFFPAKFQVALMTAAVLTGWWMWSAVIEHRPAGGLVPAASWPIYAALIFGLGLALHERVYRRWALLILAMAFAHIALLDIWYLNSLQRFYSLLCLGIVLLAVGFFYTRYQEKLHDLF